MIAEPVAVIGSGPAGLAAAFRLQQAGCDVHVYETSDHVGGKLRTSTRNGFTIEEGASTLPTAYRSFLGIVRDAGLADELVPASSILGIADREHIHTIDSTRMLRDGFRSDLVSGRSKARLAVLALDLMRASRYLQGDDLSASAGLDTESAAAYAQRRLNAELSERIVDPAVRALSGMPSADVSRVDLFYALNTFVRSRFVSFRHGMQTYVSRVAADVKMHTNAHVACVEPSASGVRVAWQDRGGEHVDEHAGCVVAVPGNAAAELLPALDAERSTYLRGLRYTAMVNLSIALHRPPAARAAYIYMPTNVHPGIDGITIEPNLTPCHVPEGKALVSVYLMSEWARLLYGQDDETVTDKVLEGVERVLPGIRENIEFVLVHRWDPMVVHRAPGSYRDLARFVRAGRADSRIQLAGDYFSSSNVNTASATGERAARDLVGALRGSLR